MQKISVSLPPLHPDLGTMIAWCAIPVATGEQPLLLAFNEQAELWQIELFTGQIRLISQVELPAFQPAYPVQLIVSPCGRAAAVSNRFGKYAVVIELASGNTLLSLERGEYHYDKSVYPLAFIMKKEQLLLVYGTDWNRLELISLLPELQPLSDRDIPVSQSEAQAAKANEHYLNYFHGELHVSPDGEHLAETGWIWGPVGIARVWNSSKWMDNVWESEDGDSLESIWYPLLDWDLPMIWLDAQRLAIWGQLDEDLLEKEDWQQEGVQSAIVIYDVQQHDRHAVITNAPTFLTSVTLPGLFVHPQAQLAVSSTGKLFAWGREVDMQAWDLSTLQPEPLDSPFQPDLYHPQADLFLKFEKGCIEAWQYVVTGKE